jgi:hypothetical protein
MAKASDRATLLIILCGEKWKARDLTQHDNYHINLGDAAGVAGNPGPEVRALLGHWAGDGGALHLTLVVYYHSRAVLNTRAYCKLWMQVIN